MRSAEAFDRMFERDKEDLRELGVPVVTGTDSAWFEDETGYRIDREAYALPPIELDAEELAVLGLASRVWQQASLAGPAARALAKLTALGVEPDEAGLVGVEPRVRTAEPSFDPLYTATRTRTPVRFTYRKPQGEVAERHVEPWAVVSRGGRWYLAGMDRDRREAGCSGSPGSRGHPGDRPAGLVLRAGGRGAARPGRAGAGRARRAEGPGPGPPRARRGAAPPGGGGERGAGRRLGRADRAGRRRRHARRRAGRVRPGRRGAGAGGPARRSRPPAPRGLAEQQVHR